jgi:hypothetical protein
MQRAHEAAEARALAQRDKTEQLQLMEIEHRIVSGGPVSTAQRIVELQRRFPVEPLRGISEEYLNFGTSIAENALDHAEQRRLKEIEDLILGVPKQVPFSALPKIEFDPTAAPGTTIPPNKVEDFRRTNGRMPTAKEMAKWITTKP